MLDPAVRQNTVARPQRPSTSAAKLPAHSAAQPKPVDLDALLADLAPADLPRESRPRILNPAEVPLTDAAVYRRQVPAVAGG